MRPFIELPDLMLAQGEKLDGTQLMAINVAARLGVAGPEVPLQPTPETLNRLAETKIIATDAGGAVLAEGSGAATLGTRRANSVKTVAGCSRSTTNSVEPTGLSAPLVQVRETESSDSRTPSSAVGASRELPVVVYVPPDTFELSPPPVFTLDASNT